MNYIVSMMNNIIISVKIVCLYIDNKLVLFDAERYFQQNNEHLTWPKIYLLLIFGHLLTQSFPAECGLSISFSLEGH